MQTNLESITVGPFQVNCFLLWDEKTGDGVIIDPGDEEELIFEMVQQSGFTPTAILLTHGHVDHIAAVTPVMEKYNIPLYIGKGEEGMLANPEDARERARALQERVEKHFSWRASAEQYLSIAA